MHFHGGQGIINPERIFTSLTGIRGGSFVAVEGSSRLSCVHADELRGSPYSSPKEVVSRVCILSFPPESPALLLNSPPVCKLLHPEIINGLDTELRHPKPLSLDNCGSHIGFVT